MSFSTGLANYVAVLVQTSNVNLLHWCKKVACVGAAYPYQLGTVLSWCSWSSLSTALTCGEANARAPGESESCSQLPNAPTFSPVLSGSQHRKRPEPLHLAPLQTRHHTEAK